MYADLLNVISIQPHPKNLEPIESCFLARLNGLYKMDKVELRAYPANVTGHYAKVTMPMMRAALEALARQIAKKAA